jgi:hypothetical protein
MADEFVEMHIEACERGWRVTGNPLCVWEAIAWARNADPPAPVPEWCLAYLGEAAIALTDRAWAVSRGEAPADKAYHEVPRMFGFVRQGKKNAFAAMADDADAVMVALDKRLYADGNAALVARRTGRNLSPERARKVASRGRKILQG